MPVEKKNQFPIMWNKGSSFYILLLATGILIVLSLIDHNFFVISWPYVILSIGLLITIKIGFDKKLGIIFFVSLLFLIFGLNFWYYYALPISQGYLIINTPTPIPKAMIFQMDEIFKINYYPDYPVAGNQVILRVDTCSPAQTICEKCDNCTLSASFINEEGNRKFLFVNQSIRDKENIEFTFPGRLLDITMNYPGLHEYQFTVPKPSLIQTIINLINTPSLTMIAFFSSIIAIPGMIYSVIRSIIKKDSSKQP